MGSYKMLFCFTRNFENEEIQPPEDIKALFDQYSSGGYMTTDHLRRFLTQFQKEVNAEADAPNIIERIRQQQQRKIPSISKVILRQWLSIGLDDFFRFLFSPELNPAIGSKVHQDMNAPLSHYYMFTGHNSYLTGNQLNSECSDIPIIKALQRGVRVIELDLWPNSKKDNVLVLHGRTLTTPVELEKCFKSIKEHAFTSSPYPVVITLEDHLNTELQAKVAQMATEIFGDMLYYPKSGSLEVLPSPESLKRRIMLSTKPPKEYLEAKDMKESNSRKEKESENDSWGKEVADLKGLGSYKHDESEHHDQDELEEHDESLKLDNEGSSKPAPEYKRIITIRAGKQKGAGMKDWLKIVPNKVSRLSLSEQGFSKALHAHSSDVVRFTQHNILRIYPKGIRVDSSNYNPLLGWIHGAQMVALNMQGYGRMLWLMHGLFRANGSCGYVKKPDFLLKTAPGNKVFDPREKLPVKKTLVVRIYMGDGWQLDFKKTHFDMFSPPDFYTKVGIAGVPDDTVMKETRVIDDNWSPVWDEEFRFPLTVPELALLRIEVHEHDVEKDDFGGQTCLPVSELRPGIRAVSLCDKKGEKFRSVKLLMRFEFV